MVDRDYQICTRCVMDTTDPDIVFDEQGICNHCHRYDENIGNFVFHGKEGVEKLEAIVEQIKMAGKNMPYDCVIGVSGGVDSTYAAYKAKALGLRILAVHLDNGWDSELAVKNIQNICDKLEIDLYTHVLDWEEFRDLQLAFLKASTPDSEIPSDYAIWVATWKTIKKFGIKYLISGANYRTESHLPQAWSQGYFDWKYIKSIHKQFGKVPLRKFPHAGFHKLIYYIKTIKRIDILNYLDFRKKDAMEILERELDWKYYGGKHYESIYTRFYQGYILPKKFGFDKRRNHLSSLICAEEISRQQALKELEKETYPAELQLEDREYVIKKLEITENEFDEILNQPLRRFQDYPSYSTSLYKSIYYRILRSAYHKLSRMI